MELRTYLRIVIRKWWVFIPAFLITLGVTAALTFSQPYRYQARSTFVLRPASFVRDDRSLLSGLETLSRRTEIASTFALVADSRFLEQQAADQLGLTARQRKDLSASSRLIAGTNILEISAQGGDPALVADYANTLGANIVAYARDLYDVYELEPLDEAVKPNGPISPNRTLNLALGGIVGLVLGVGLSFLAEYLRAPETGATAINIVDGETGAHNRRFFLLRLKQEMSRARRNGYPLSVALLDINHRGALDESSPKVRREALRRAVALVESQLREEDVLARFDDTVLAILLPDVTEPSAKEMIEGLRARLGFAPLEIDHSGLKLNMHGAAGVVAYSGNGTGQDELLNQATLALKDAGSDTYGKVRLFSEVNHK